MAIVHGGEDGPPAIVATDGETVRRVGEADAGPEFPFTGDVSENAAGRGSASAAGLERRLPHGSGYCRAHAALASLTRNEDNEFEQNTAEAGRTGSMWGASRWLRRLGGRYRDGRRPRHRPRPAGRRRRGCCATTPTAGSRRCGRSPRWLACAASAGATWTSTGIRTPCCWTRPAACIRSRTCRPAGSASWPSWEVSQPVVALTLGDLNADGVARRGHPGCSGGGVAHELERRDVGSRASRRVARRAGGRRARLAAAAAGRPGQQRRARSAGLGHRRARGSGWPTSDAVLQDDGLDAPVTAEIFGVADLDADGWLDLVGLEDGAPVRLRGAGQRPATAGSRSARGPTSRRAISGSTRSGSAARSRRAPGFSCRSRC